MTHRAIAARPRHVDNCDEASVPNPLPRWSIAPLRRGLRTLASAMEHPSCFRCLNDPSRHCDSGPGALASAMKHPRRFRCPSGPLHHPGAASGRWHLPWSIRPASAASMTHRVIAARLRHVDICDSAFVPTPLPPWSIAPLQRRPQDVGICHGASVLLPLPQ